MREPTWRRSTELAWTAGDAPSGAPRPPKRITMVVLAVALAGTMIGTLASDTLCPQHRAWIDALGTTALVCAVVAVIGLLADWSSAPLFTLFSATLGVSIGLIDSMHAPTRGRLVALAFAALSMVAGLFLVRVLRWSRWDRAVAHLTATDACPVQADAPAPVAPAGDAAPVDRSAAREGAPAEGDRV